ncbi:MAG: hypothetical protein GYA26_11975 [Flexilinea flocculi]|nr:hypothetical protein [Flexilinea flocculi]
MNLSSFLHNLIKKVFASNCKAKTIAHRLMIVIRLGRILSLSAPAVYSEFLCGCITICYASGSMF